MPPGMAWQIESQRGVKLFVAIPRTPAFKYQNDIAKESWESAWQPPNTMWKKDYAHGVATAREKLAESFLESDCTHLLHLDSDIVLRPDTIQKMLELNKDVVVARYHETSNARLPEAFRHSRVPFRRDAPIDFKQNEVLEFPQKGGDVLLSGLGLVLVKREVYDKLKKPFYLFSSEYEELSDYWKVSEDFYFLLKLQCEAKVKITYAPSINSGHIGECIVWDFQNIQFI